MRFCVFIYKYPDGQPFAKNLLWLTQAEQENNRKLEIKIFQRIDALGEFKANQEKEALKKSNKHQNDPDVIFLDTKIFNKLRSKCANIFRNFPRSYIVLIALRKSPQIVRSYIDCDIDDFISKPLRMKTIIKKVNKLFIHGRKVPALVIQLNDLKIDTKKLIVKLTNKSDKQYSKHNEIRINPLTSTETLGQNIVKLTKIQMNILYTLIEHRGFAISRDSIITHVWGKNSSIYNKTVDAHIANIRKKLQLLGKSDIIESVRNKGYLIGSKRA